MLDSFHSEDLFTAAFIDSDMIFVMLLIFKSISSPYLELSLISAEYIYFEIFNKWLRVETIKASQPKAACQNRLYFYFPANFCSQLFLCDDFCLIILIHRKINRLLDNAQPPCPFIQHCPFQPSADNEHLNPLRP